MKIGKQHNLRFYCLLAAASDPTALCGSRLLWKVEATRAVESSCSKNTLVPQLPDQARAARETGREASCGLLRFGLTGGAERGRRSALVQPQAELLAGAAAV